MTDLSKLKPGLEGHAELVVGEEHTAPRIGSGRVRVLATPVMINLMEAAALGAQAEYRLSSAQASDRGRDGQAAGGPQTQPAWPA
jgi:hypothetical protein